MPDKPYTAAMMNALAYHYDDTPLHRCDARVKVVLVFVYSIALLCVQSWALLGALAAVFVIAAVVGRLSVGAAARQLAPLGVILLFTIVVPAFPASEGFAFSPEGALAGCMNAVRIALLLAASLVITGTTSGEQLARAFGSLLSPLARLGVPTRDIATAASIALRFIPLIIDEYHLIRAAQVARGAHVASGSLLQRVRAWGAVFTPLIVGLYRRAETLATAMDARCYGYADQRGRSA